MLQNEELRNGKYMAGWVHSFWRDDCAFVDNGFGFCLLEESETVASWCLTVYRGEKEFELGVATAPAYQDRGFAGLVGAACVDHARAREFSLHWHCWEENVASIAVAEKLGFGDPTIYTVYRIPVPGV
jgi:RimJ/RimL family protein N-acetyltransferase